MSRFFRYETITESKTQRPTELVPPAVTICFPYHELLNYSLALLTLSNFRELVNSNGISGDNDTEIVGEIEKNLKQNISFKDEFFHSIHEEYTIPEIMSVVVKLDYMLGECITLALEQYSMANCSSLTPLQMYVKDDLKCYQFGEHGPSYRKFKYDLQKLILLQYPDIFLYRFKFIHIDLSLTQLVIYIHPRERRPCGGSDSPFPIEFPARKKEYYVGYNRAFAKRLPSPYKSNCYVYPTSRYQMLHGCVRDKLRKDSNRAPPWLTLRSDIQVKTFYKSNLTKNESDALSELTKECFNEWPQPDCVTEIYKLFFERVEEGNGNVSMKIDINLSTAFETINELKPFRELIDIFVDVGSVLGFWFGIYAAGIFKVQHIIKKNLHSKTQHLQHGRPISKIDCDVK